MSPCDTPRFSFCSLFKMKFPPPTQDMSPHPMSQGGLPGLGAGMGAWALGTLASPCLVLLVSFGPLLSGQSLPCSWSASSPCPSVQQPQAILSGLSIPCPTSRLSAHTTATPPGPQGLCTCSSLSWKLFPSIFQGCLFLGITPQKRGLSAPPGTICGAP